MASRAEAEAREPAEIRKLSRELVGGEGKFAPRPAVAAPARDFFQDIELEAKMRFSPVGADRQAAHRELAKQRQAQRSTAARTADGLQRAANRSAWETQIRANVAALPPN